MFEYADRTALTGLTSLITGASSRIGGSFARRLAKLAANGMNLVLFARNGDRLNTLADELRTRHRIEIVVLPLDLWPDAPDAVPRIEAALTEHDLKIALVNNAGFGTSGAFAGIDPIRERDEILVDVLAVVDLPSRRSGHDRAAKAASSTSPPTWPFSLCHTWRSMPQPSRLSSHSRRHCTSSTRTRACAC